MSVVLVVAADTVFVCSVVYGKAKVMVFANGCADGASNADLHSTPVFAQLSQYTLQILIFYLLSSILILFASLTCSNGVYVVFAYDKLYCGATLLLIILLLWKDVMYLFCIRHGDYYYSKYWRVINTSLAFDPAMLIYALFATI